MKTKRKQIIFFSKDLNIGGMEKSLITLLNSLNKEKYEITLVLEKKEGQLLSQLDKNIIVKEFQLSKCRNVLFRKFLNFTKRFIWSLKNRNKYDFSCNYATYSIIGSKLALKASKNNAIYIHSNYYNFYNGDAKKIINFFKTIEFHNFKNAIFVSNEAMNDVIPILEKLPKNYLVINNLIDYQQIEKLSKEKINIDFSKNKIIFAFVGRLEEESKRVSRLIKAFNLAIKHNSNLELWIIGDGKDKNEYLKLTNDLNLIENIKFIGKTTNPYAYIKNADCIILTSDYEGFPVVYYEALVLGKNIITTINTSDEVVNIKDYAIIVNKNENDIANAIINFKPHHSKKLNIKKINYYRILEIEKIIDNKQ